MLLLLVLWTVLASVGRKRFDRQRHLCVWRVRYWWIAITPDGDRIDLCDPTPCDPSKPLPEPTDAAGGDADADPRVWRLTEKESGCVIKVKCRPQRADGETVSQSMYSCLHTHTQ